MAARSCRVCGRELFRRPLLRYANMPKAAQKLPDAADLAREAGVDLEVRQCAGCGLVQLANEPVPYFREAIRAAAVSDVVRESKTRQFGRFVEDYDLYGGRILEVGCGRGEYLSLLQSLDVIAFGLEYSECAVAECAARGLSVSRGYPGPDMGLTEGAPFDAFLLLMFLEHMPDPTAALRAIGDNLAENAVGLIEVPSFDMVLRKRLFSEFIVDHLLYFTAETLRTTLELNGFQVLDCREVRDDYVISVVVRKRGRLDISDFHRREEEIAAELIAFVGRFAAQRVAVWGAGHQAFALLALAGIADRIRYVVDSAAFKQGRYTPATHLPIVAPEALVADPVDAVIVVAGSYSDEVLGILRRQSAPGLSLAVVRDSGLDLI